MKYIDEKFKAVSPVETVEKIKDILIDYMLNNQEMVVPQSSEVIDTEAEVVDAIVEEVTQEMNLDKMLFKLIQSLKAYVEIFVTP